MRDLLGVPYNAATGRYGRESILFEESEITFARDGGTQFEGTELLNTVSHYNEESKKRLGIHFHAPHIAALQSYYSSSAQFLSITSGKWQLYVLRYPIAWARIQAQLPHLSERILSAIQDLPDFSEESKPQYYDFFGIYGTHVLIKIAMGGVLRIFSETQLHNDEGGRFRLGGFFGTKAGGGAVHATGGALSTTEWNRTTILRDGGGSVDFDFAGASEGIERLLQNPKWQTTRERWVNRLEQDPVFCPDDPNTQFMWIYHLDGLSAPQSFNLRLACESYLSSYQPPPSLQGDGQEKNRGFLHKLFDKIFGK